MQRIDDPEQAARRLLQGGLVAFPTETVYGLGADAGNAAAVALIYAAKGRPEGHPLIVHLAPGARLEDWAATVPHAARRLVDAFWPGPLTLVLPRADHVAPVVTGGQDTVGLRCPSHPVAQAMLAHFSALQSGPAGIAAPSANLFGQVSPTTAGHVLKEFERTPFDILVLEGAPSQVGIESTILDLSRLHQGIGPVLLRPGQVTVSQIEMVVGMPVSAADADAPRVSGSLKAHYAPRTPLQVLTRAELCEALAAWPATAGRVVVWSLDPQGLPYTSAADIHPAPVRADDYARQLYARLRAFDDAQRYARIMVEHPPDTPAWAGVTDRLRRAAAAFTD